MKSRAAEIIRNIGGKFAAGVSGGADSMCLLSLIISEGRSDDVTVLHIDHGIRTNSGRDRLLVEDFCGKNGIAIEVFCIDVIAEAKKNKRSTETEARLMRHAIFSRYCKCHAVPLLLAHNLDDNAETVLMHIFRGCGINGLIGMGERDRHIIRPLISVGKSEIYDYVKQQGIPYAEDETNQDTNYRRNHVRALLPIIEKGFPSVKDALISLSRIAAKTQSFLDLQLNPAFFTKDGDAVLLDKRALDTKLAHEYVIRAVKDVGLNVDFEEKHAGAVIALGSLPNGKSLDLPHSLRVYNEYNHLAFEFFSQSYNEEKFFIFGENRFDFEDEICTEEKTSFDLSNHRNDATPRKGFGLLIVEVEPQPIKGRIIIDADKMAGAKLRTRRDGDRFYPCGGKPKKLKEYLNEKKIPIRKRERLPLLAIGNEVLVVAGLQLSESVKITSETKRAYEIKLIE